MTGSTRHPHLGITAGHRPDDLYATRPPWDIGRPQPAFLTFAEAGALQGRALDADCGTGEHAIMTAELGLDATGVDLAENALHTAARIDSIEPSTIDITTDPDGIRAWLVALTRT